MNLLEKQIRKMFARNRNITGFDELNVISASKTMYKELDEQAREAFLKLARERYKDFVKQNPNKTITAAWIATLLASYDAVTKYVYEHEVDRKRARMAEAVIASDNKLHEMLKARNLWINQVKQYTITVEDSAVIEAYKALGVERVKWNTERDAKVCSECMARSGKVYRIGNIPPKPHPNCRCYLTPVNKERNT